MKRNIDLIMLIFGVVLVLATPYSVSAEAETNEDAFNDNSFPVNIFIWKNQEHNAYITQLKKTHEYFDGFGFQVAPVFSHYSTPNVTMEWEIPASDTGETKTFKANMRDLVDDKMRIGFSMDLVYFHQFYWVNLGTQLYATSPVDNKKRGTTTLPDESGEMKEYSFKVDRMNRYDFHLAFGGSIPYQFMEVHGGLDIGYENLGVELEWDDKPPETYNTEIKMENHADTNLYGLGPRVGIGVFPAPFIFIGAEMYAYYGSFSTINGQINLGCLW